jgi:hypothetical protein
VAFFWRVRLVNLCVVAVALACLGGYWGVLALARTRSLEPFKPHMAEYLAPAGPVAAGPVRGKVVVLDRATGDFDWDVFFALPDDMRAARPDEVGTVVWLDYGREKDASFYDRNGQHLPAFRQTCTVRVIDAGDRHVLANAVERGGDPPSQIDENATEGVGPKPTAEVVHYLRSLPRK